MEILNHKLSRRAALMMLVGGAGGAALIGGAAGIIPLSARAAPSRGDVTLYKNPQCGCVLAAFAASSLLVAVLLGYDIARRASSPATQVAAPITATGSTSPDSSNVPAREQLVDRQRRMRVGVPVIAIATARRAASPQRTK